MNLRGQWLLILFSIERLSAETVSTHLRFTTLVILSDSKFPHLARYNYQKVIVGIKPLFSKEVVCWV